MKDHTITRLQLACLVIVSLMLTFVPENSPARQKPECPESISIDGHKYFLTSRWCGHKVDSSSYADVEKLVRLPDELTFQEYRIYVTPATARQLLAMTESARSDGVELIIDSGYRSVWYQKSIIRKRLALGEDFEKIISFVAPPGYSQHHTGRAIDFVPSEAAFAQTPAYHWLKQHAHEYNFYEVYPKDTTGIVPWESWHWLYQPSNNK